jgi:uncharacterized protein involved in tolerance to divalent cations
MVTRTAAECGINAIRAKMLLCVSTAESIEELYWWMDKVAEGQLSFGCNADNLCAKRRCRR